MNFFTPKFIKIGWYSIPFGCFAHHFQIKLSIHGLSLSSILLSLSRLKLLLLLGILTQNSNIVELVEFLEKNQKLHIQIVVVTSKVISLRTMNKQQN
jgi:hypothetical protein